MDDWHWKRRWRTDNPRLHRNTHEGIFASYGGIESTALNVGYIKRWAGYGAPGDFTRFHRFDADETFSGESDGMAMIGIEFQPMEDIGLKGWYFSIDRIADIYTADIEYKAFQSDDTSITLYGQYVEYNEQSGSGYEGQVGGIGIEVEYEPFSFYAAYNHGETKKGKQILAPYGRGPFLVDLEEFTIQEMQSPRAWMLSGGYSISEAFSVELMHGEFKMAPTHSKLSETAGVITYNEDQPVSGRMSYAKV